MKAASTYERKLWKVRQRERSSNAPAGPTPSASTAGWQRTDSFSGSVNWSTKQCSHRADLQPESDPPQKLSQSPFSRAEPIRSTSSVAHQVTALERKGVLYRDAHRPRAYRVRARWAMDFPEAPSHAGPGVAAVPLVGRIAAGAPILAEEAVEDVLALPRQLVGEGRLFALKVVGDSMIDAAICDGNVATVRQADNADHGDIVTAMIDGEATVKRLHREDGHVWLMPHNAAYEPILGDDAVILGKVVAVLRTL
ncbi:transcriptional repressor LexA [Streptomyces sp. NPDC057020]|uniref:transcriptional repressor LexA n=1 Tax=unclassified Streptomyces TaxID=2593676 RepID=UPI00362A0504